MAGSEQAALALDETEDAKTADSSEISKPSIEDTIREKLAEIRTRGDSETADDDSVAAAPPQIDPNTQSPETPEAKAARIRDGKGQFAKTVDAQGNPIVQPLRAPNSWTPRSKNDFAKLPEHIKAEVLKREDEFHQGIQEYKTDAQIGKRITEISQPYAPLIKAEGANVEAAFADYLNSAFIMRQGDEGKRTGLVAQLCKQFGVNPMNVAHMLGIPMQGVPNAQQAQYPAQNDPNAQRIAQLENFLRQQQEEKQQQTLLAKRREDEEIGNMIKDFASNDKYQFFEDVKPEMAVLLQTERAKNLAEAYDMACWARPDIRPLLLQQQEAARREDAQKKTRQARYTAGTNVTHRGAAQTQAAVGSIEDTIRSEMKRLGVH